MLMYLWSFSKFFGRPNGTGSKPQQSTLAFNKHRPAKPADGTEDGATTSTKAEDDDVKMKEDDDADGDHKMEDEESVGMKEEGDQEASQHLAEPVESVDGHDAPNGVGSSLPPSVLPIHQAYSMWLHLGDTTDPATSPADKPTTKSPAKRSKGAIKEEEEDDDDDEEPVRKRSRHNGKENAPNKPAEKSDTIQTTEPTKATKHSKTNAAQSMADKTPSKMKGTDKTTSKETTAASATKESKKKVKGEDPASAPHLGDELKRKEAVNSMAPQDVTRIEKDDTASEVEDEEVETEDEDKPEVAAKAREKVQSTLTSSGKDPYPDWKPGEPVPYAALCTTFSLIELTTKRLVISAHCSLFLRQVLRLTPDDLLPTVQLMINKLAADYAGIELGIGESLIMKAIGESTGRSLSIIKADQNEIGDLGLVAAKSRSNQPTMFKPKALTVRGVLEGLMGIATVQGDGSQGRKIAGIKKLLSAADASLAGKGSKGVDITKDKGGASEAKFLVRFLEGKLRLGLAEKTVLVALAHAVVIHETEKKGNKLPSSEQLAKGESILKTVYR